MSEGNGISAESWRERFDRLEKSHVQLMTEHELWVAENEKSWDEQRNKWAEHLAWKIEADRKFAEQGERVDRLISGIGELIAKMDDRNYLALVARVEALEKRLQ